MSYGNNLFTWRYVARQKQRWIVGGAVPAEKMTVRRPTQRELLLHTCMILGTGIVG